MSSAQPIQRRRIGVRRLSWCLGTVVVCALLVGAIAAMNQNLLHGSYVSGYMLLAAILFLAAFNVRKKLTFLPQLGNAATWMQLHIYVGFGTIVLFGSHIAWRVPTGMFESLLALLYVTVAASGIYGLIITRMLPKRLTAIGDEVIFERIPLLRLQIARQARQAALGGAATSEVIPSFYLRHLQPFFERPRGIAWQAFPNGRRQRKLVQELGELNRYLATEHRSTTQILSDFVRRKDDLDYHYAAQGRLKLWLFLHIGFTYSLIALSLLHALLVHAFIGGPA